VPSTCGRPFVVFHIEYQPIIFLAPLESWEQGQLQALERPSDGNGEDDRVPRQVIALRER